MQSCAWRDSSALAAALHGGLRQFLPDEMSNPEVELAFAEVSPDMQSLHLTSGDFWRLLQAALFHLVTLVLVS